MALKRKPFYNNHQLQRVLVQLTSVFAGYQVETGDQRDGKPRRRDVPVLYGDMDRVAAYIMGPRPNQENGMSYVPFISVYMTGMRQNSEIRQNPQHVEKYKVTKLARDEEGKVIVDAVGKREIVERYMPVPYDIAISVSIWSSNNYEGFQLVEQIATQFNPSQEIQFSNSSADWSMLSTLFFNGDVEFEKSYPSGNDVDPLYIYKLGFTTIIWLSVPAKVYDQKLIHKIDVPIHDMNDGTDIDTPSIDSLLITMNDDDQFIYDEFGS